MSRRRSPRRILGFCLLAWPAEARRRDGPALLDAVDDQLAEPGVGTASALWTVAAEAGSILWAGLALRARGITRAADAVRAGGWAGDLRWAIRSLRRAPSFSVVAVVTLGAGIGANAAVFGLVERVLLRPPPFPEPDRLVVVWSTGGRDAAPRRVPAPVVALVRERARLLASVAFVNRVADAGLVAGDGAAAEPVTRALVTPDLFDVLGVRAELGRTLDPRDATPGGGPDGATPPRPAVLSHATWLRVFGADPAAVGREVRLDGSVAVVVGVMPETFRLDLPPELGMPGDVDVWVPLASPLEAFGPEDGRRIDQDSDNTGVALARLAADARLETARAEVEALGASLREEVQSYASADLGLALGGLQPVARARARPVLVTLLFGSVLVLLVMCMNVGTLVLARGVRRRDELALRIALGAGRARILRQLVVEGAVLVGLACALGWLLASMLVQALWALAPAALTLGTEPALGWAVLGGTAALGGGAAILLGLAPATAAGRAERRGGLGGRLRRGAAEGPRLRGALVSGEVALSVVLTLGAALLLRSVAALGEVRPGFEPGAVLTFDLSVRLPGRYPGPADRARVVHEIGAALSDVPGVRAVGVVGGLPLAGERWTKPYGLPGQAEHEWQANRADFRVVTSGYFDAAGTRLLEGRAFTAEEDLVEARRVAVVDETVARHVAPSGSAVGHEIAFPLEGAAVRAIVVGVVERVRYDDLRAEGRGAIYVPYRQEASRDVSFLVRTSGSPAALAPDVRRVVREVDPQLPVRALRPMSSWVDDSVAPTRFALVLLAAFALLALASAAIGLYGVVAYEVGGRTREIGVRLAVGASRAEVVRGVLAGGMRRCGAGLALGAVGALAASRVLGSLLYGVRPGDPATWSAVLVAVAAVSLAACWLPARRASRLDPTAALRAD